MRLVRMGWLTVAMAAGASGQQQQITVGLENALIVPFAVLAQAQATASRIYAAIGVNLTWRSNGKGEISMQFDTGVAATDHPGAMAYAAPYAQGGTRIHVLIDRLQDPRSPRLSGLYLGHVMAHELGHVLEGISRHSDSGVMKARWDATDFEQMAFRPLSFSDADVELIRSGVARRMARPGEGTLAEITSAATRSRH